MPIDDINWLNKRDLSKGSKNFSDLIKSAKAELEKDGIEDSIWVNISVKLESVKKVGKADVIVAVDNKDGEAVPITQVKTVRLTNNDDAQAVRSFADEELDRLYPYRGRPFVGKVKEQCSELRQTQRYREIINEIKQNPKLTFKVLDSSWRFSDDAIAVVIEKWNSIDEDKTHKEVQA